MDNLNGPATVLEHRLALDVSTCLEVNMPEPIVDLPGEIWKPVVGWEGLYEVSNMGRVQSLARLDSSLTRRLSARILQPIGVNGYPRVNLWRTPRRIMRPIYRLVLEAFVGPCPEGMEACHNNGLRADCRLTNLRWDTPAANSQDKIAHGTWQGGEKNNKTTLTDSWVVLARQRYADRRVEISDLCDETGLEPLTIRRMLKGRTWPHLPGALDKLRQWYELDRRNPKGQHCNGK